ncbi:MAG: tRNA pseudouridine(13) synthase TruD [Planctomycetota bacterium]
MPTENNIEDASPHITPASYLSAEVRGIGGALKQRDEDFSVEELPLYNPSGDGEHVYLLVEKRGMPTIEMLNVLSKHFRVPRRAMGYAGLKDKVAVTRQVVSIHMPGRALEDVPSLEHPRIAIQWADRHENKLRRGHLAGNRFSIRVRGVKPEAVLDARRTLDVLTRRGLPDRVGEQRFGYLRNNHLVGRALFMLDFDRAARELCGMPPEGLGGVELTPDQVEARTLFGQGDYAKARKQLPRMFATERQVLESLAGGETPEQALLSIDPGVLSYYLSAFQSAVFNAALDDRLANGTFDTLLPGDIAVRHTAGKTARKFFAADDVLLAEDTTADEVRSIAISPTGPMWGAEMQRATGKPGDAETEALRRFGVRPEDLSRAEHLQAEMTRGTRRPYRVPLANVEVEGGIDEHGPFVRCAFDLPRGAFATTVMGEVMKNDAALGLSDEDSPAERTP